MGDLAIGWGQHMAESPVNALREAAMEGHSLPEISPNDFATMIIAEIAIIHETLLEALAVLDRLVATSEGTQEGF